jgi:hypothetical protein
MSHLQAATPFLLTGSVILVASALSLIVIRRAQLEYEEIVLEYETTLNAQDNLKRAKIAVTREQRTVRLRPEYLADVGNWLIDGGGMFASLLGPLIGLAVLYERFTEAVFVLYTVVILLTIAGFALFVTMVAPSGYPGQPLIELHIFGRRVRVRRLWIFTPVAILTALVNFVAGAAVLIAGP